MSKVYPAKGLIGGAFGDLDEVDGLALIDSDAAIVITSSGVYNYTLNATSGATENSPYIISPDANAGDKRWILVTPQGPFSYVEANTAAGQSIPDNISTTIIFGTEIDDELGEYVHTTGIFTAIYAGKYSINSNILFSSAAWTSGNVARTELLKDGVAYRYGDRSPISDTENQYVESSISTVIKLAAGENIRINILQNSGGARTLLTDDKYNWLTINRLP